MLFAPGTEPAPLAMTGVNDLSESGEVVGIYNYVSGKSTYSVGLYLGYDASGSPLRVQFGTFGGTNSALHSINEPSNIYGNFARKRAVGSAATARSGNRAMLWEVGMFKSDGTPNMLDMNALGINTGGFVLSQATKITDGGLIIGSTTAGGGFLVEPNAP
jgi:hypothetical protein